MDKVLKICFTASASFVYLFIISKVLGKKQIAQLDFIDYVVGISIGSIAAEMATDLEVPFYHYLVSMTIFFLFDIIITIMGRKGNFMKTFLKGRPMILIKNGKIDYKALKKSKLDVNDLIGLSRSKNYFDLKEIAYAIFETNGELSVLAKESAESEEAQSSDAQPAVLNHVIFDGKISESALSHIQKDKSWLFNLLPPKNYNYKDIILATYDMQSQKISLDLKSKKELVEFDCIKKKILL